MQTPGVGVGVAVGGSGQVNCGLSLPSPVPQAFCAFTLHLYVSPGWLEKINCVDEEATVSVSITFPAVTSVTVTLYAVAPGTPSQAQIECDVSVHTGALEPAH